MNHHASLFNSELLKIAKKLGTNLIITPDEVYMIGNYSIDVSGYVNEEQAVRAFIAISNQMFNEIHTKTEVGEA